VLNDGRDGAVFRAQDPAVTGGIVQVRGEDGDGVAVQLVDRHEFAERVGFEQRDITVRDDDGAFQRGERVQCLQRNLDGAAGAGDFVLVHDQCPRRCGGDVLRHPVPFVPDDNSQGPGIQGLGGGEGVPNHGGAANRVENLRSPGLHPGAGSGRQDYNCCGSAAEGTFGGFILGGHEEALLL
jgi:hypothetical protein